MRAFARVSSLAWCAGRRRALGWAGRRGAGKGSSRERHDWSAYAYSNTVTQAKLMGTSTRCYKLQHIFLFLLSKFGACLSFPRSAVPFFVSSASSDVHDGRQLRTDAAAEQPAAAAASGGGGNTAAAAANSSDRGRTQGTQRSDTSTRVESAHTPVALRRASSVAVTCGGCPSAQLCGDAAARTLLSSCSSSSSSPPCLPLARPTASLLCARRST